jgi:hypothetical protein
MKTMSARRACLVLAVLAFLAVLAAACAADGRPSRETTAVAQDEPARDESVLVGAVTREQVEAAVPDWVQAEAESQPNAAAAKALAAVEPGAEVTVFLGTWCGDSRRELSRLWRALDETGGAVPFEIRYVGVDENKEQPADLVSAHDVRYVPTFIVRRGGREVGRIVEHSPHGVEEDLLALLTGESQGLLSASPQLATETTPPSSP